MVLRVHSLLERNKKSVEEIRQLIVELKDDARLKELAARHLGWPVEKVGEIRWLRRSVDARKKGHIRLVYRLEVFSRDERPPQRLELETLKHQCLSWQDRPRRAVVIGAGPAGLFAALELLRLGWQVEVIERGAPLRERHFTVAEYFKKGVLDPDSNLCFGLGGAGFYSDGKLNTRIKHPEVSDVLERLVCFGAPEDILWRHDPHVGSNLIREIIGAMADAMVQWGVGFHFHRRATGLRLENGTLTGVETVSTQHPENIEIFDADAVFFACGHGAEDSYRLLQSHGVALTPKDYAVGFRVQHPQEFIDRSQYGNDVGHPALESARYRLTANLKELERGVYTFCMCPGGYVVPAATDTRGIVVNGMSNRGHRSPWANAAVVATVSERDWGDSPLASLDFRTRLERAALESIAARRSRAEVPAMRMEEFLHGKKATVPSRTSCLGGCQPTDIASIFPDDLVYALKAGLERFERKIRRFSSHPEAMLFAVESRTSAPLQVSRDRETLQSTSHPRLYPIGEGAGWAGGITSSAVDGLRAARKADETFSAL